MRRRRLCADTSVFGGCFDEIRGYHAVNLREERWRRAAEELEADPLLARFLGRPHLDVQALGRGPVP